MKNLILILILLILTFSVQAQNWEMLNTGTTSRIYDMSFPAGQNNIGYAATGSGLYSGVGTIIKTEDGGDTWTQVYPVSGTADILRSIFFTSVDTGYAGGLNDTFMKTTDGGETWTNITISSVGDIFHTIDFIDADNGITVANPVGTASSIIYVTADAGATWTVATGLTQGVYDITYSSADIVVAVGAQNQSISRSTDGGLSWTLVNTGFPTMILLGVDFAGDYGVAVGSHGDTYISNDAGANWNVTMLQQSGNYEGIHVFNADSTYFGGMYEEIYKTTDGGTTWEIEYDGPEENHFYDIEFTGNGTGFAGLSNGNILRKTVQILDPPVNLFVSDSGYATWDTPSNMRDLLGYNVYLDGVFIAYTADLFYDYDDGTLIDGQSYLAEVTAVYDEGESDPVDFLFTYQENNPYSEFGFLVDYNSGDMYKIDLANPTDEILIGNVMSFMTDIEFGPDNVLYGLPLMGTEFIQIDTTSAVYTQVGTSTPLADHMWTGLAYDVTTSTMYAVSIGNDSAFYSIDVTTGEATLIGTTLTIDSVADIAFDADGQMYAHNLQDEIYLIDKTNGTATLLGETGFQATGPWHGMDYSFDNDTMYLSTYNGINFEVFLGTVDLTNGNTTFAGEINHLTGGFAITHPEGGIPAIAVFPTSVVFDSTAVGSSSDVELTVYNTGNADLEVSEITISTNIFSIDISSFTVAPADSQIVLVTFTPIEPIAYSDSLIILNNDPEMEALIIQMSGTGYNPAGIESGDMLPDKLELFNNFPNPFNPETTISYQLPENSKVELTVYNLKGQKVKQLVSEQFSAGHHSVVWDGKDENDKSVASGVYFYRLNVNKKTEKVKKMLLLK